MKRLLDRRLSVKRKQFDILLGRTARSFLGLELAEGRRCWISISLGFPVSKRYAGQADRQGEDRVAHVGRFI